MVFDGNLEKNCSLFFNIHIFAQSKALYRSLIFLCLFVYFFQWLWFCFYCHCCYCWIKLIIPLIMKLGSFSRQQTLLLFILNKVYFWNHEDWTSQWSLEQVKNIAVSICSNENSHLRIEDCSSQKFSPRDFMIVVKHEKKLSSLLLEPTLWYDDQYKIWWYTVPQSIISITIYIYKLMYAISLSVWKVSIIHVYIRIRVPSSLILWCAYFP